MYVMMKCRYCLPSSPSLQIQAATLFLTHIHTKHDAIITDRLHVGIAGSLLGMPVKLLAGSYYKVWGENTWIGRRSPTHHHSHIQSLPPSLSFLARYKLSMSIPSGISIHKPFF